MVDGVDIEVDQALGILARRLHLLTRRWIAKDRHGHLVELHITAARRGELGELLLVHLAEIREEGGGVAIHAAISPVGEAAEVHRRRRRHGDLRRARRALLHVAKFVDRDGRAARDLGTHVRRGELAFMPLRVVEAEHGVAHFQARREPHEFLPVRDPAKLAVADHLQAAVFLQPDDVADGGVLRRAQFALAELAAGALAEGFAQRLGPQQAADVVGAVSEHRGIVLL